MSKMINGVEYTDLNDLVKIAKLTDAEILEMDLKAKILDKMLKARASKGLTQRQLEAKSGVKQPLIARIEKGNVDPQITTILKILKPLGFTLDVVKEKRHI